MSEMIVLKVKTKKDPFSIEISNSLFEIVKHACERKIAITFYQKVEGLEDISLSQVDIKRNELLLSISDSYNRELASPLIGSSREYEVQNYRPEPLLERLVNLQGLFEFIYEQENILQIDLLLTDDDLRFDTEVLDIEINNLASFLEPIIEYEKYSSFHYQFSWSKKSNNILNKYCSF